MQCYETHLILINYGNRCTLKVYGLAYGLHPCRQAIRKLKLGTRKILDRCQSACLFIRYCKPRATRNYA